MTYELPSATSPWQSQWDHTRQEYLWILPLSSSQSTLADELTTMVEHARDAELTSHCASVFKNFEVGQGSGVPASGSASHKALVPIDESMQALGATAMNTMQLLPGMERDPRRQQQSACLDYTSWASDDQASVGEEHLETESGSTDGELDEDVVAEAGEPRHENNESGEASHSESEASWDVDDPEGYGDCPQTPPRKTGYEELTELGQSAQKEARPKFTTEGDARTAEPVSDSSAKKRSRESARQWSDGARMERVTLAPASGSAVHHQETIASDSAIHRTLPCCSNGRLHQALPVLPLIVHRQCRRMHTHTHTCQSLTARFFV